MEIWKDIKGYERLYMVSNEGRIKSLPKQHRYGSKVEKILKSGRTKKQRAGEEYPSVFLSKDGVVKEYKIHRLVAMAFIPNPLNKPEVNHRNGIKNENRVGNLEWATAKENSKHSWDTGLSKISKNWKEAMKKNKGRKHTTESIEKMRNARLGKPAWNKGLKTGPLSDIHKELLSKIGKTIKRNRNEKTGLFEKN